MDLKGIELRKGVKSESIRIKFMYRGMECRESLKLSHTKANINYAVRLRGEILNAIEKNTFRYIDYFPNSSHATKFGNVPSKVTVDELLQEQLRIADKTLSPSTARGYKQVYESHLKEQFGKLPLIKLTPQILRAWVGTLDCKIKTVRNILTPLRNALEQAVNDDLITSNPLERVKLAKIMPRENRKSDFVADPFSMVEIDAILKACTGQERNVYQFAFATGMRTSELIALEWGSIDWINCKINVERKKVEGITEEETKTITGKRAINMTKGAYDALIAQKEHTALQGKVIFHDARYGKPWADDQAIKKRWMIALRKAGVRYRNPYQTRHTFASTLLSSGSNPLFVAKQMGHRDTEMITRNYGRWIDQDGSIPDNGTESVKETLSEFFAQISPTRKHKIVKS
jgi:integrase